MYHVILAKSQGFFRLLEPLKLGSTPHTVLKCINFFCSDSQVLRKCLARRAGQCKYNICCPVRYMGRIPPVVVGRIFETHL